MIAIVLFGGVCSGKTELASHLEKAHGVTVISKDRFLYESDLRRRSGDAVDWQELRQQSLQGLSGQMVVLDETVRIGSLQPLKNAGYRLIGVKLVADRDVRRDRLRQRVANQRKVISDLSTITGIDLTEWSRERRQGLWQTPEFYGSLSKDSRGRLDAVLRKIYLSGSDVMNEKDPNPACFPELDDVLELESGSDLREISASFIVENAQPYSEYRRAWFSRVKHVVWDVGGVAYRFTFQPLSRWLRRRRSRDTWAPIIASRHILERYMRGEVNFEVYCRTLCEDNGIPFSSSYTAEMEQALRAGVGSDFVVTTDLMSQLASRGIANSVLSNAMAVLADEGGFTRWVERERRFYSFDSGLLKPSDEAYGYTRDRLRTSFAEMIFVDDKDRNTVAATNLGLYSITFKESTIRTELAPLLGGAPPSAPPPPRRPRG